MVPYVQYGDKFLYGWSRAEQMFSWFKQGADIILDSDVKLKSIELYENGVPQRCRCIKTNTGQYQIGDFINHNTTTLSACINDFSNIGGPFENSVIISLEDPIEYVYPSKNSTYVVQKELGADFREFASGVKQALREHPTFINVGETRDIDTINAIIDASRTGHGVLTSFHSSDVADTISRLYNYLSGQNDGIMYDLISNMNMIVCQRLVPNGQRFELSTQYMEFNNEITKYLNNMIRKRQNIPFIIHELFASKEIQSFNVIKDWD
jgi:Tfp pilus assembly pilus retraction ATPase PilT